MKKLSVLMIGMSVVLLLILFAGCAPEAAPSETSNPEMKQEEEVKVPSEVPVVPEKPAAAPQENKKQADTTGFIGEEKAKELALGKAGLTAAEVVFDRVELDKENGVWYYEVEFKKGRTEYSADIRATDGVIFDWEVDYDD